MLIAESRTRAFLASIVPVIVNTVLNEHQLVLDIVAFVSKGDFPRSRLGEKQRGKILASWVSRKMRTIAQFSIRDPDAEGSVGTAVPEDSMVRRPSSPSGKVGALAGGASSGVVGGTNARAGSVTRAPGTAGSSLRNVESISQLPRTEEQPYGMMSNSNSAEHDVVGAYEHDDDDDDLLDDGEDVTPLSPPDNIFGERDSTPTNERPHPPPSTDYYQHQQPRLAPLQLNTTLDYSPVEGSMYDSPNLHQADDYGAPPGAAYGGGNSTFLSYRPASPIEMQMPMGNGGGGGDMWGRGGGGGGGLRVANRGDDSDSD